MSRNLAQLLEKLESQQQPAFNGQHFGGDLRQGAASQPFPMYGQALQSLFSGDEDSEGWRSELPPLAAMPVDYGFQQQQQNPGATQLGASLLQVLQQQAALQQEQQRLDALIDLERLQLAQRYLSLASDNGSTCSTATMSTMDPYATWLPSSNGSSNLGGTAEQYTDPNLSPLQTMDVSHLALVMQYLQQQEQHQQLVSENSLPNQHHQQHMMPMENTGSAYDSYDPLAGGFGFTRPAHYKQPQQLPSQHQHSLQQQQQQQQLSYQQLSAQQQQQLPLAANAGPGAQFSRRKAAQNRPSTLVTKAPSWAGADWHPRKAVVAGAGTGVFLPGGAAKPRPAASTSGSVSPPVPQSPQIYGHYGSATSSGSTLSGSNHELSLEGLEISL